MTRRFLRFAIVALAVAGLAPAAAPAQVVVKVSDTVNFRLGFQLQGWSEWLQDPVSEGYQQNFKIRRVRLIVAGQVAKNVTFFMQTDNANLGASVGTATKSLNTGLVMQDAFGEWHPFSNDMFIIDFGKMLTPFTRNSLQSTSSHLALDGGTWTFLQSAPLQNDAGRDVGLQLKSYLAADHLEIRTALLEGIRAPANANGAGSRNPYRFAGRIVYNVFDTEKGYVPVGTNLGKKKILSAGARAANCLIPTLFRQQELFTDVGFYFKPIELQPFIRFETENFKDTIDHGRNIRRYMGGFNYYVAQQNMKITAAYERIVPGSQPATAKTKNSNHFVVQLQFYYF
ncbi:MAG: OprO/OprP family phosphate-selective porin [Acidobacteria bacterium]|nr:OprO/OprP family phosphate-selective porin [Acidobacteriota bacterium]